MIKKQGDDWMILWSTKHIKYGVYTHLKKYQRVNQFPRSYEITRKDLLVERIERMQELHNVRQFDFLPLTIVVPKEMSKLKMMMMADPNRFWIVKPAGSAQGKGIYITNNFDEI